MLFNTIKGQSMEALKELTTDTSQTEIFKQMASVINNRIHVLSIVKQRNGALTIYEKFGWKSFRVLQITQPINHYSVADFSNTNYSPQLPYLTVHGNLSYQLDYRSTIDTPYKENDIYQHSVQGYIDIGIKNKFPMRIYLTNRWSNSNFFNNLSFLNFQFNQHEYSSLLKQRLQNELDNRRSKVDTGHLLKTKLNTYLSSLNSLKSWVNSSKTKQRLVEIEEKKFRNKQSITNVQRQQIIQKEILDTLKSDSSIEKLLKKDSTITTLDYRGKDSLINKKLDSLKKKVSNKDTFSKKGLESKLLSKLQLNKKINDSLVHHDTNDSSKSGKNHLKGIGKPHVKDSTNDENFLKEYHDKQLLIDSLQKRVDSIQLVIKKLDKKNQTQGKNEARLIDKLMRSGNLKHSLKQNNISDTCLPKGYEHLYAIRSFGIGKTIVNYSELTAKNLSINGIQVAYNPSYYTAFAIGNVQDQYNNFKLATNVSKQQFSIIRVGYGFKENNYAYLSYFAGTKQGYYQNTSGENGYSINKIIGYSIQVSKKLHEYVRFNGEFAKSSLPYNSQQLLDKSKLSTGLFQYGNHTNQAFYGQLVSQFDKTQTSVIVTFKQSGQNYQSFSTFYTGAIQNSWSIKAGQYLWKRQLNIVASVFSTNQINAYPASGNTLTSNTVFKSILVNLKIKKWPFISASYYPSSQVMKVDNDKITENKFYVFNLSMTHSYQYHQLLMSSTYLYTHSYNHSQDSGFHLSNSKYLLYSHSFFLEKWQLQSNWSMNANQDYHFYVLENCAEYKLLSYLTIGCGLKYNRVAEEKRSLLGYSFTSTVSLKKIGDFQFLFDKGYIIGNNNRLIDNNIGRFSFNRIF